jgi:hypothetical protein
MINIQKLFECSGCRCRFGIEFHLSTDRFRDNSCPVCKGDTLHELEVPEKKDESEEDWF